MIGIVQPNVDLFTPRNSLTLKTNYCKEDFEVGSFYIWNYEPGIARLVRVEAQRKEWEDRSLSCRLVDNCNVFIEFRNLNGEGPAFNHYWLVSIKADVDKFDFYRELFDKVWSFRKPLDTTMLHMLETTQEEWDLSSDRYLKRHYGWGLKEINNILKDQRELDKLCMII